MKTTTLGALDQRVKHWTEMLDKCLKKDVASIKKRLDSAILDLELAIESEEMDARALK